MPKTALMRTVDLVNSCLLEPIQQLMPIDCRRGLETSFVLARVGSVQPVGYEIVGDGR